MWSPWSVLKVRPGVRGSLLRGGLGLGDYVGGGDARSGEGFGGVGAVGSAGG